MVSGALCMLHDEYNKVNKKLEDVLASVDREREDAEKILMSANEESDADVEGSDPAEESGSVLLDFHDDVDGGEEEAEEESRSLLARYS